MAENRADVAAIDCVTFAFVRDEMPELAQRVREFGWTAASPGLPLIAANTVPQGVIESLRAALNEATAAQPERAARLRLKGFASLPLSDYVRITQLENEAQALGLADRTTVLAMPADRAARMVAGRYDLVFADPPYAQPYPATAFATLRERGAVDERSLVVYEHSARSVPPDDPAFCRERTASYGAVALTFLRAEAALGLASLAQDKL